MALFHPFCNSIAELYTNLPCSLQIVCTSSLRSFEEATEEPVWFRKYQKYLSISDSGIII